ncbi:MAG: tetratricopeptide repeat protein [Anaerolineales bacterium]|nr:tetratricopeptide repeat protein [Chloroflexota bacterium]MBL6983202.1 tetratricopeptide repeat protein [Anaerolineales bacterium]
MASQHIVNVNESSFDYEVIEYSQSVPVLVDFWAEWSIPCKTLDPILRDLAVQGGGNFRLAKLNVDENPKVALRFNVHSLPIVKAFREGGIIAEFSGLKPEDEIRRFLRHVIPSHVDLSIDKGRSMLRMERWDDAAEAFQTVLDERPDHSSALVGLAKSMLALGQTSEALEILESAPTSRESKTVEILHSLAIALEWVSEPGADSPSPIESTYQHALRLVDLGNFPAAMDGILAVLRQDKHYRDDEARRVILGLFEILGEENPLTRQYRNELASILF